MAEGGKSHSAGMGWNANGTAVDGDAQAQQRLAAGWGIAQAGKSHGVGMGWNEGGPAQSNSGAGESGAP